MALTPTYNEHNLISGWPNFQPRYGQRPTLFVLHTSEGAGGMNLVNYMRGAGVSYHYVVDNNGDVFDLVDTDDASWSVLDANGYCVNLCFGASFSGWSRQDWLDNMGHGIDIAAWIAVQDCHKYGIPTQVLAPPYHGNTGITDHKYVTQYLGIGTHTDVGYQFPWDVFTDRVNEYANNSGGFLMALNDDEQRELLDKTRQVWDQLRGPDGHGWAQLDNLTPVDALAAVKHHLGA